VPGPIAQRRLLRSAPPRAVPPPAFGAPVIMGDPTTVPEQEIIPAAGYGSGTAEPEPDEPDEPEPLWLKMPAELAPYFDLGFSHGDVVCPYVTLRVRDDTTQAPVEVSGPPSAFLGLAQIIAALCEAVPCISHDAGAEETQRQAG
jgi:hypothetical protein